MLTPLGVFNDWIPPTIHTGYYSVTDIDPGDDFGYYVYLRSLFFDGDLDFYNERVYAHVEHFNSTGYVFNNWQIGQSLFVFPFFLLGHFGALFLSSLGYPVATDGYSFPYYMSTALASQTYLFLGLLITFQINRKYFSEKISLLATLAIWIATPLIYYTFIRQRMAHTVEFFLSALFILVWLSDRDSSNRWKHALMGSVLGVLGSVRVMGLGLGVLYIVDLIWVKNRFNLKKIFNGCLIYFGLFFLIFLSVQSISWWVIEGFPLPIYNLARNKSYTSTFSLMGYAKSVVDFFLGYKWGVLFSSPVIVLGIFGTILFKKLEESRLPVILAVLAYVVLNIYYVYYLASYQFRYLIPIYPLVALGLGWVFNEAFKWKYSRLAILFLLFVFVVGQYLILIQYKVTLEHQDVELTIKAFSNIPIIFIDRLDLLLRSSNIFKLLFSNTDFNWTYKEVSYFIIFPLLQFVFLIFIYKAFCWGKGTLEKTKDEKVSLICVLGVLIILCVNIMLLILGPEKTEAEIAARRDYMQFIGQATEAQKNGKIDERVILLEKATQAVPEFWIAHLRLAIAQGLKGLIHEADKNYEKALGLNPQGELVKYHMAQNMIKLGELHRAEDLLRLAIKGKPRDSTFYHSLALLLARQNRFKEAASIFEEALVLNPKLGKAHFNYGILLMKLNRMDKAMEHMKSAVNLGVKNPGLDRILKSLELKNSD